MSHLALFLFGPPRIELDSRPVEIDRRKAVALIAYLAVTTETHSRDALATLLWPNYDQRRARAALRRVLVTLNKALTENWLEVDRETISLNARGDIWVDVSQFHQQLAACLAAEGDDACKICLPLLSEAVKLYRAHFMEGFTLRDSPNFDEWQFFQAETLRRDLASALTRLIRCHSAQGEFEPAIAYARRWLALDPLYESAHRQLMQLYAWNGQRSFALRQYQECARILKEELGALPTEETTALYEELQQGTITPKSQGTSEQFSVSLDAPAPLNNFPAQPTPFIGRQTELAEILKRLQNPDCHLLTLVGPGGIGKTRLAIQTAIEQRNAFTDGLYFIPLAPVSSPDFLVSAVADSLELPIDGQEDPLPQLLNYLRDQQMLLVMDNFEHLLRKVDLLTGILKQAPQVKILVTSRERLNLQGEWVFEVRGLVYPQDNQISKVEEHSAVALFLQRAYRVHSSFTLTEADKPHIVRICRLVAGMPLSIELAAAWVRVLSCEEIAAEIERMYERQHNLDFLSTTLQDIPERHQSLQAVFDHSWQLLSSEEKRVFSKLSVFRGGCRREAIEWVTGANLQLLSTLVDKSLLTRSTVGHYEMHELLRQYATEKLHQNPAEAEQTRDRHREYFAIFLKQREELLKGAKQKETLAEIGEEIENIRLAWRWAIEEQKVTEISYGLESLAYFYRMHGWFQEGIEAFGRAVAQLQAIDSEKKDRQIQTLIGQILTHLGWYFMRQGLYEQARDLLQQSMQIFQRLDDQSKLAVPLHYLGILAGELGDRQQAKKLLRESLAIYREVGDRWSIAWCLCNLGYRTGEMAGDEALEAKQLLQESLAIYKAIGDKQGVSAALNNLGYLLYMLGEYDTAKDLLQESLVFRREIGYVRGIAVSLNNLGHVTGALGAHEDCKTYYYEGLKIALDIQATPLALAAMGGLAVPLAQEGKTTQALELLSLALHHPASNGETRDRATDSLKKLETVLPSEVIAPAYTSTNEYLRKFEALARTILAEGQTTKQANQD